MCFDVRDVSSAPLTPAVPLVGYQGQSWCRLRWLVWESNSIYAHAVVQCACQVNTAFIFRYCSEGMGFGLVHLTASIECVCGERLVYLSHSPGLETCSCSIRRICSGYSHFSTATAAVSLVPSELELALSQVVVGKRLHPGERESYNFWHQSEHRKDLFQGVTCWCSCGKPCFFTSVRLFFRV